MKRITIILLICLSLIPACFSWSERAGVPAEKWVEIDLLGYWGRLFNRSSELEMAFPGEFGKYDIGHIIDKDVKTAWVEGVKGDGIGEYILIVTPEETRTINIYSGYGQNLSLFNKNNRPQKLRLSYYLGVEDAFQDQYYSHYKAVKYEDEYVITLQDSIALQHFDFPFRELERLTAFKKRCLEDFKNAGYRKDMPAPPEPPQVRWILKIEILAVYQGSKWDDTCISEIFFNDRYIGNSHDYKNTKIEKIYESENYDKIIMITGKDSQVTLGKSDNEYTGLTIGEISKDKQWLIVMSETWNTNLSRTETEYLVFNAFLGRDMKTEFEEIIGKEISGPFLLNYKYDLPSYEDDELYLEFEYYDGSGSGKIELK
ncbi:MAG: hypothetical protein GH155_06635 [Spirochaeta sp.]|nr:hypothetical protein [Spirochaeta sp.]